MKSHISFSEFSVWNQCSYKHRLQYIDKIDLFEDNEFLSFGKALHSVAEDQAKKKNIENWEEHFDKLFLKSLQELKKKNPKKELDNPLICEMRLQGKKLSSIIFPTLREQLGDFEVLSTEENLYEEIKGLNLLRPYNFKGFIDLVVHLKKENKILILDHKTTTAGWFGRDRTDKMKLYQLIFYKHFYAQKYGIDMEDIDIAFCLLKRKPKKDNVEIYRVTSGEKRTKNALELLEKSINSIIEGKHWKNKRSCERCPYKGIYCK